MAKHSCLEKRRACPFPSHFHGYVEVLYLKKGSAVCTVDFKEYELCAGDVLFVFPDRIHSVDKTEEGSENYLLFFPKEVSFFGDVFENKIPSHALLKKVGDSEIDSLFLKAYKAYGAYENEYARGEALGHIFVLLAKLLPCLGLEPIKHTDKGFEKRVIEYCTQHFTEPIKLNDIAHYIGYTPSYFSDAFSKRFNVGFSRFLSVLRVEDAKKMLMEDVQISDAALGCGFESIRTFNRVFKEYTGKTPKEYRKSNKG